MHILLIGCGRMGGAMLNGWRTDDSNITVIDVIEPSGDIGPLAAPHISVFRNIEDWSQNKTTPDFCILAIKPQVTNQVCAELAPHLPDDTAIISIVAAITMANLATVLGKNRPIIRAMPNTPGAIGKGVTGIVKNHFINEKQLDQANKLLSTLGISCQISDEEQLDLVTALSGSGPAYFFQFVEHLGNLGKELGLNDKDAAILARQTFIGAAALLDHEESKTPAQLRTEVTSPGGLTEAALEVLNENRALESLIKKALEAAIKRAKDLA